MNNLTTIQKIAITMAVLGVISTSGVQLTDIMGAAIAKSTVSVASLVNSVLAAIVAVLSGQSAIVKQVQDMPGVSKIITNSAANETLKSIAEDPANSKVVKGGA